MHIARAVKTPAVILFGPTPVSFFGYNENINIQMGDCRNCWWSNCFWFTKCPKFRYSKCMRAIKPRIVFDAITGFLYGGEKPFLPRERKVLLWNLEDYQRNERNAKVDIYDDAHFEKRPWQKEKMKALVSLCKEHQKNGNLVLDVAASDGYLSNLLQKEGFKVVPIDISQTRVKRMKELYDLDGKLGDIRELPFTDKSFDIVIGGEILEHLPIMSEGLAELERVVKDDGLLLITLPVCKTHDAFPLHKWTIRKIDIDSPCGKPDITVLSMKKLHR